MNAFQKTLLVSSIVFIVSCGGEEDPGPPVNYPPVAVDDETTALSNEPTEIDVLANDTDEGDHELTLVSVDDLKFGTVSIENNKVIYTSDEDFTGTDNFTYVVSDGVDTDTGIVTVTVAKEMSISGRVIDAPIANAELVVTVSDVSYFTTADDDGFYTLDIRFVDETQLPVIYANGIAANNQEFVDLSSTLDSLENLYEAAGEDKILDRSEASGTYVTNLTTASQSLISSEAPFPKTSDELSNALAAIDPTELLEIAAVIKLIIDDPNYSLPEETPKIRGFIGNRYVYNSFVENVKANNPEVLTNMVAEILADENLVANSTDVPGFYVMSEPIKRGFVSQGLKVMFFNQDGTGKVVNHIYDPETFAGDNIPFTWDARDTGYISIVYDEPLVTTHYDNVRNLTDDTEIIEAYETFEGGQVEFTRSITAQRFKTILSGARNTLTNNIEDITVDYVPIGIGAETFQIPTEQIEREYQASYINGDKLEFLEITEEDVVGNWAFPVIATFNDDIQNANYASDLITFNADHTFSGRLSQVEGTWELLDNTQITMTYDDIVLSVKLTTEKDGIYEAMFQGATGDGYQVAKYDWAVKQEDNLTWNADALLTLADEAWSANFNPWYMREWNEQFGKNQPGSLYGWQFMDSEQGYYVNIPTTESEWVGEAMNWSLTSDGTLLTDRYAHCEEKGLFACYREWIPLLMDEERYRLIVLDNGYYQWTESSSQHASLYPPQLQSLQRAWLPDNIRNPNYSQSNSVGESKSGATAKPIQRVGFLPERGQPNN